MREYTKFYIDGEWVDPASGGSHDRGDRLGDRAGHRAGARGHRRRCGRRRRRGAGRVRLVVADARPTCAPSTSATSARPSRRKFDDIVDVITSEVGSPKVFAELVQAGLGVSATGTTTPTSSRATSSRRPGRQQPDRAASPSASSAAITPWNYPLYLIVCKVGPALAAGCTVVLKPSEVTPLNAYLLAEAIDEVGLPAGVFNLVVGTGPEVGAALSAHPDVDMVSLHGFGPRRRRGHQGRRPTRSSESRLELGGKSANIVLDDADPATVAQGAVFGCFINSGQTCSALTRLLVPRSREQEFVDAIVAEAASSVKLVDPKADEPDFVHIARPAGRPRPNRSGCAATSRRASTRARRSPSAAPSSPRSSPPAST